MSATFLVPVHLALTTVLQDIFTVTPAGKVRTMDLRYANVGAADAYADVVATDGVTVITRAKNFPVTFQSVGGAPDMEQKIVLPAGWKLQGKASANGAVEASLVNIVETDVTDFT